MWWAETYRPTCLTAQEPTMHQVTTMQAPSKNVIFPGYNHLLTTGTDDPTLWLSPELDNQYKLVTLLMIGWIHESDTHSGLVHGSQDQILAGCPFFRKLTLIIHDFMYDILHRDYAFLVWSPLTRTLRFFRKLYQHYLFYQVFITAGWRGRAWNGKFS